MVYSSSCAAVKYTALLVLTTPFSTFQYGVSINPNLLTRPYVASVPIKPIFGPSGVSIGHILP